MKRAWNFLWILLTATVTAAGITFPSTSFCASFSSWAIMLPCSSAEYRSVMSVS